MPHYYLVDCDFSLLQFKDGKEEHRAPSKDGIQLTWGLEATLKRDLSNYYYFSVNRMNVKKGVIPGKAYVNDVEAECISDSLGEYLIQRDLVKEPLAIRIESVPALRVSFRGISQFPVLGLAGQEVVVSFDSFEIGDICRGNHKPIFVAHRKDNDEVVELQKFSFTNNPVYPWASFLMPPFDIEIEVLQSADDSKATLHVDPKGLGEWLVDKEGIVSEALYSDDYDFGIEDHYFFERSIRFPKGKKLKVEFRLSEKKEVECLLNDVTYSPARCRKELYYKGEERITYEYRFDVTFREEGTLSFRILD